MERTIKLRRGTGKWMTLLHYPIFIVAIAGLLVTSAVACPILMSAHNDTMPCSQNQGNSPQCPFSFYVAAPQVRADAPILRVIPAAMFPPPILWTTALIAEPEPRDDKSPPGHCAQLFLQTHSLLI